MKARKVPGVDGQPAQSETSSTASGPASGRPPTSRSHRSTNTCHLGNIAYKLGRKLAWDAEAETFKNDPEANALLSREPRRGYELPKV